MPSSSTALPESRVAGGEEDSNPGRADRVRSAGWSELYAAETHLVRALTARVSVRAAAQITPLRYGTLRKSATRELAHHYGRW